MKMCFEQGHAILVFSSMYFFNIRTTYNPLHYILIFIFVYFSAIWFVFSLYLLQCLIKCFNLNSSGFPTMNDAILLTTSLGKLVKSIFSTFVILIFIGHISLYLLD